MTTQIVHLEHAGIRAQDQDIEIYKFQYFGNGDPTPEEIDRAADQQLVAHWVFHGFYSHTDGSKYIELHKVPDVGEIF